MKQSQRMICAICPSCNRPELLGRAIRAFEKQTYKNKFLIIVDDIGQYDNQSGNQWQLVSFPRRCLSLGEKNNLCASLAPREVWAYAKWDDDDIYMPWHLEALADAMNSGGRFVQPRRVCDFWHGKWTQVETFHKRNKNHFCYHGAWGYTRELYAELGGYRNRYAGDDGEFQNRTLDLGILSVDTDSQFLPSYFYNRPLANRISEVGGSEEAYWNMAPNPVPFVGKVPVWEDDSVFEQPIPKELITRPW